MASQIVSAAKRYRISLLLDAYGELLTEKQRTFLHLYFEEDLSFGEIARDHGVSRQAIFDSVKHGEEALENFERVLHLVENGWARWMNNGQTPERLVERLSAVRSRLDMGTGGAGAGGGANAVGDANAVGVLSELDILIAELRGGQTDEEE